jgi:hypothetical protein
MRPTLQIKLALGVTGIVTVIMGLSAFWLTMNSRARLVEDYRNFAIGITQVAEAGLENAMISRIGPQWELRPVLALGDQHFAFALPLDPGPPRSEPSTRGSELTL